MNFACCPGLRQGIRIQVADHQNVLRAVMLNHGWQQPSLFFKRQFHGYLPKQKNRWAIRASGLFELFSKESARQSSAGAAAGRDGDGVDAPSETLRLQNTRQGGEPPIETSRPNHQNFEFYTPEIELLRAPEP